MNHLERMQEVLPGPYALADDAVLTDLLDLAALELETLDEDLDRMRQSHWIRFAYRLMDAEKIAALVGIQRLPWEGLQMFRERLIALVVARLSGALGPLEIKRFAYDYLSKAEDALGCVLVPGLKTVTLQQAFESLPERPRFRPLELREYPHRPRSSGTLQARGGMVPYLYRWREHNKGLDETVATFSITGLFNGRTTVPVLVNVTTGALIGYGARVPFGQTVVIRAHDSGGGRASATVDGVDVSAHLFSMEGFTLGVPFERADLAEQPRLPRMARGANDWIFLSVGLYDIRGLNKFFFAIADNELYEAVLNETAFDHSLFPSGPSARLEMDWIETEPASFELRVPRCVVSEPAELVASSAQRPFEQVADGLIDSIRQLHAAGVRAELKLVPFQEKQTQQIRVSLPWKVLDRELAPAGTSELALGGTFGESPLGGARYE